MAMAQPVQLDIDMALPIGDLPEDIFKLANDHMAGRISNLAGRQPRAEGKHPEPRLSKRALAASQGRIVPEKAGVHHVITEAKKARRKAKTFSSQLRRRRRSGAKATPG
jgi:hypothetical protein